MTTEAKPKAKRKRAPRKTTNPATVEEPSFYARALSIEGRFALAWMLQKAAIRILIRGRALV